MSRVCLMGKRVVSRLVVGANLKLLPYFGEQQTVSSYICGPCSKLEVHYTLKNTGMKTSPALRLALLGRDFVVHCR